MTALRLQRVLTLTGCGLTVAATLVSALDGSRRTPVPEPAVDHDARAARRPA